MWESTITNLADSIGYILYYVFKFIELILNPYVAILFIIGLIFLMAILFRHWRDAADYALKK